jgi:4-hydroxy-tetrahydrodipicolinate synthase
MARFGEVVTAMVTPFDDDLAVDVEGAARLARWLVDNGSTGLVVAGTTGESSTLSTEEHLELARAVRGAVTAPVIVGTGSNDAAHAVAMTKEAEALGADAVLVVSPYYNKPPQAGIEAYYRDVAAATSLPVVVYDVPGRTGRRIDPDVVIRLANEVPNIVAFKDATGDPPATARVVAETPDDFDVYSGDDSLTLPLLAVGAVGVVGVATHWAGPEFAEMISCFGKGDVIGARRLNARLGESYDFSNSDAVVYSMAAKAMLRAIGLPVGQCRPPLTPTGADVEHRARGVLANLHA